MEMRSCKASVVCGINVLLRCLIQSLLVPIGGHLERHNRQT